MTRCWPAPIRLLGEPVEALLDVLARDDVQLPVEPTAEIAVNGAAATVLLCADPAATYFSYASRSVGMARVRTRAPQRSSRRRRGAPASRRWRASPARGSSARGGR